MAQFLRGKQAGVQRDLSAGLVPEVLALDNVARYGINSQISAIAYDPVQSLLAVGTNESRFGTGQIYVFGRKRFCGTRLLSVDSKNDITVFSLSTKGVEASYAPPGRITALLTDPTLDYAFIGLQNGEVIAYDMDRHGLAQLRIPNLWRNYNPQAKVVSIVDLALHPRDVGTLLVAYTDGVVVYSFKQIKATLFLQYELNSEVSTRYVDPLSAGLVRHPKIVHATWHPTGTFILTGYDDESLVIWDSKSGKIVHVRTVQDANMNVKDTDSRNSGSTSGTYAINSPLFRLAWCSKQNPDDTGILVAGGGPSNVAERGLTFFDLGQTPVYQTSSWQVLSDHFGKPNSKRLLPTPPNTDVVDFCVIPRDSPHYAGSHDPIAIIALLSSGEITTLSFPSGYPITPTNQLPTSLTFVHPFVNKVSLACIERTRWLGMTEKRSKGPSMLKGGAGASHPLMRFEDRNIIQTAHADGTIRIWDAGHGDEIENEDMLQVDVARAIGRAEAVQVAQMSMSGATGELAVGMLTGEVVVFGWDRNRNFGRDIPPSKSEACGLESIRDRADPDLKEGLLPSTMFTKQRTSVTALRISDIGFVAAGFESGGIAVIDMRGPALIYDANVSELIRATKRGSIRKTSNSHNQVESEWPTVFEFGVMSLEGEDYSSILLFVGTNIGRFVTFKLLPKSNGGYMVQLAGTTSLEDMVVSISTLNVETGKPAFASQAIVSGLRQGEMVNGVVLVVTRIGAKLFKPAAAKGASKTWNEYFCDSAAVVRKDDRSTALVVLFGDGVARTFSIPGLKEIASARVDMSIDVRRFSEAIITSTGDIFGWTGPSEIAVLNPLGSGIDATVSNDQLFNPELLVPPRPTISNIQWMSGTQYFTPSDLDLLVGGPERPPSKRMIEQMRADDSQRREALRFGSSSSAPSNQQDEGYMAYMQRQIQQRTEKLNIMGDSMDRLEQTSSGWAEDVNKFVSSQKKKAVMGIIGSKFGL